MQLVGLYDLAVGALLKVWDSPWSQTEGTLFEAGLREELEAGDMLIGDRHFGSWYRIALCRERGAHVLFRLFHARKHGLPRGVDEAVQTWKRPLARTRPEHVPLAQWEALPEQLTVRLIRYRIEVKGFRTEQVILSTTDLETPPAQLIGWYRRRWEIETTFDDFKTALGMDHLRSKSWQMAWKELLLGLITHNLIRWAMARAATCEQVPLERISFTGTCHALRTWTSLDMSGKRTRVRLRDALFAVIADDPVPFRPNRSEPRCVKRRPKGYQLMTKPRKQFVESPSRRMK
jgi:hypothetical protein